MSKFNSPLKDLKIASPCSADWAEMYGSERQRFCGDCKLNVYNLSGMTTAEAEQLIQNAEGRLCVRFYMRADGSVLTQDCPVGWAKVKQRLSHAATAIFSLVVSFTGGLWAMNMFGSAPELRVMGEMAEPYNDPKPTSTPKPKPTPNRDDLPVVMGAMPIKLPPKQTPTPSPKPKTENEPAREPVASKM